MYIRACAPTETQIGLLIRAAVRSVFAVRNYASLTIQKSTLTILISPQMQMLIWIFAGKACPKIRFWRWASHKENMPIQIYW